MMIFFLFFFARKWLWPFMQIVSDNLNLDERLKPIFKKKKKKKNTHKKKQQLFQNAAC